MDIGKKEPLAVKPENVVFFEVETNDQYNYASLTQEEKDKRAQANAAFEEQYIQQLMLNHAAPCQCQTPRIMERVQARLKLGVLKPGPNGEIPMELLQEDLDTRKFGVIVTSENGFYKRINMLVTQCKGCGDIHLTGDIDAITRMFAKAISNEIDIKAQQDQIEEAISRTMAGNDAPADGPAFVLENTETGERRGADDLGAALFGGAVEGVVMTPVEEDAKDKA